MQNRYRRLPLMAFVSLWAAVGVAGHALAVTFTEFPGLSSFGGYSITVGSDGMLWFVEFNSNKIGRITTDGVISEFNIPTTNSGPLSITSGPDGALWFTETGSSVCSSRKGAAPLRRHCPMLIAPGPEGGDLQ
jgi:streptogramin lyase